MKSLLALCAMAILLVGCAKAPPPAAKDTLVWATVSPVHSLDIAHGFDNSGTLVQFAVLDTVVTLDRDGKVVPSGAVRK
ncbi:hypothetical protein AB0J63_49300 [Streptosporangium canum]|uniref:hypothetical protein n=1 Tax=Streptosporangium canum TaxID=324952 RepID=UPI003447954A